MGTHLVIARRCFAFLLRPDNQCTERLDSPAGGRLRSRRTGSERSCWATAGTKSGMRPAVAAVSGARRAHVSGSSWLITSHDSSRAERLWVKVKEGSAGAEISPQIKKNVFLEKCLPFLKSIGTTGHFSVFFCNISLIPKPRISVSGLQWESVPP